MLQVRLVCMLRAAGTQTEALASAAATLGHHPHSVQTSETMNAMDTLLERVMHETSTLLHCGHFCSVHLSLAAHGPPRPEAARLDMTHLSHR